MDNGNNANYFVSTRSKDGSSHYYSCFGSSSNNITTYCKTTSHPRTNHSSVSLSHSDINSIAFVYKFVSVSSNKYIVNC